MFSLKNKALELAEMIAKLPVGIPVGLTGCGNGVGVVAEKGLKNTTDFRG